jgi:hypothetical protein
MAGQWGPHRQWSTAVELGPRKPLKISERFSLTPVPHFVNHENARGDLGLQQESGAVAAGQLDNLALANLGHGLTA